MIEETGRVLTTEDGFAEVETIRTSSCTACRARHGCGHHAVAQLSSTNRMRMRAVDPLQVEVGQEVIVGIPEDTLLKASIWMYCVPLMGLVLGASLPSLLSDEPIWSVIASIAGFAGGLLFARKQAQKQATNSAFQPRILRVKSLERSKISIYQHS